MPVRAADLAPGAVDALDHARVVAHVLRLERRHLQAQVAVVAAQRGGEPAFAGAAGGAQHHDAAGQSCVCSGVGDCCHGRNDTRCAQGSFAIRLSVTLRRSHGNDTFCRSTEDNVSCIPLPRWSQPSPDWAQQKRSEPCGY